MSTDIRDLITVTTSETVPVVEVKTEISPIVETIPTVEVKVESVKSEVPSEEPKDDVVIEKEKQSGIEKKFAKMTARQYAKDAEIENLRRELEQLKNPPKPVDLDSLSVDDRIAHIAKEQAQKMFQEANRPAPEQSPSDLNWDASMRRGIEKYPDFLEVIQDSQVPMSNHLLEAIKNSDVGDEIVYKLANDQDLAMKLSKVDPITQAKMLLKMETEFEIAKAPIVKVSQAPSTTAPMQSAPAVSKNPNDMSMKEYIEYRKSRGTLK